MPLLRPARLAALAVASAALLVLPAAADAKDRDRDGLPDRWEQRHRVKQAAADPDRDGLTNRYEYLGATKPRKADSDRDGTPDAAEDPDGDRVPNGGEALVGFLPRDIDSDDDGVLDGDERAGVIVSADGGVLTIDLVTGGRLSVPFDAWTTVACDEEGWEDDEEPLADDAAFDLGEDAREEPADPCLAALAPGALVFELEVDEDEGETFVAFVDLLG